MLLNELSPAAQAFFKPVFDLSEDLLIADCRSPDFKGSYPLHYAVRKGEIGIIKELVHNGANINQLDETYENWEIFGSVTPLMRACQGQSISLEKKKFMIEHLLRNNADINFKNEKGQTVLTFTIFLEDINLFAFLLEKGANPFYDTKTESNLKFRLINLIENKPYQFTRVLGLLAKEAFMHYPRFEQELLRTLKEKHADILASRQVTTALPLHPLFHALLAQNPAPVQATNASNVPAPLPRAPRFFLPIDKMLKDLKNGERMIHEFRAELDKESFRAYLEMTSKLKQRGEQKKLPVDIEKKLAVEYFGFSYPKINRKLSVPSGDSKEAPPPLTRPHTY